MDMVCAPLAFIEGLGGMEMMLIFVLVLVLFGGNKLPEFARGLGKTIREFKKAAAGVEDEFKRALEEDERKQNLAQLPPASTTPPTTPPLRDPAGPDATYHPDEYHDHDYHADETYGGGVETKPAVTTPATGTGAVPEAPAANQNAATDGAVSSTTSPEQTLAGATTTDADAGPSANPEIPAIASTSADGAAPALPAGNPSPKPPPPAPAAGNNPLPS